MMSHPVCSTSHCQSGTSVMVDICYSDGQFDIPDRTFHSMHTSWLLSSEKSSTDVKELIPEFFYLPEFMINYEGKNSVSDLTLTLL